MLVFKDVGKITAVIYTAIYNFLFFGACNYSSCNSYVGCIIWINTGGFCWY